ncbi:hypothetical protein ABY45_16465 [Microbacterium maritypicum]|uniref:hypothetical protein n=1 Tax=Microbacterium maritypicum TaxID=33918 RepID=UPI003D701E96
MNEELTWLVNLANIATVFTGIAVLFAVVPYFQGRRQRMQDANNWYVERYWQLQDRKTPSKDADGTVRVIVPFEVKYAELRLCEDELDARADGRVTNDSWELWSKSILALRTDSDANEIIAATSTDELVRLRAYLADEEDPIRMGAWSRFWRGL